MGLSASGKSRRSLPRWDCNRGSIDGRAPLPARRPRFPKTRNPAFRMDWSPLSCPILLSVRGCCGRTVKRLKGAWLGNTAAMMHYRRIVNADGIQNGMAMIAKIIPIRPLLFGVATPQPLRPGGPLSKLCAGRVPAVPDLRRRENRDL